MKKLGCFLTAVLGLVVLLAGALVWSSLPDRSGTRRVAGIRARVTIETDAWGIPTIRAAGFDDALFGLGWAHARDRLWQMELQRRIGSGRLAEALGKKRLPTDRFLRTVGFRRAAESSLRALSPEGRAHIAAYRQGVNAYLASTSRRPVELRILRIDPAPFDDVDCLVWSKLMAWDLSGNAAGEIRRAHLIAVVGQERAAQLLPPAPIAPTILREGEWQAPAPVPEPPAAPVPAAVPFAPAPAADLRLPRGARPESASAWNGLGEVFAELDRVGFGGETVGSNSWVIAGSRTLSGRPILANDPHLGLRTPSIWYLARLVTPGLTVEGATLPGLPAVVIGRNDRIAWGLTNLEPDVQDLYLEHTDPADPARYLHAGRSLPFETRTEVISVRGGNDETLRVRSTIHGPVVTDVLSGAEALGGPVTLRWTGLDPDDRTPEALLAVDRARDWKSFVDGVSLLHCPAQNFVYADVDGHIGYTSSGSLPLRPHRDGLLPADGSGADDWTGFIPFDSLPRVLDPARGYVITANNRVAPESYPWPMSRDWPEPYRAHRIEDLILATPRLGPDDVVAIQLDRVSYQARELLPLLLDTVPADAGGRDALAYLQGWNGKLAPDSIQATIYAAWYAALSGMAEDELKEPAAASTRTRFLVNALKANSPWCDDVRTPKRETCADFKSTALSRAIATLRTRLGPAPAGWKWGRLHRARFPHAAFDGVPVLSRLFSLESGQGGDASTVNVGAYRRDGSFRMSDGPSYRQIVDFADLPATRYVHTTGQSGNPFERHYRDMLPLWKQGRYFRMDGKAVETTVLNP